MTETDKQYNKKISHRRVRIEHAINRLKWFRRMSAVHDDSKEEFYKEIQVVSRLTNLHILFNDRKYIKPMEQVCSQKVAHLCATCLRMMLPFLSYL
ncbi:MAG: hypothetical protein K8823_375 [Cenarchaeum symbiont of Oopsacas minuta]|nr:hypothetical protein [Cenarchaeum symbiont of Oopsacas minuta]